MISEEQVQTWIISIIILVTMFGSILVIASIQLRKKWNKQTKNQKQNHPTKYQKREDRI